jgi:low affinity Fe/Cu permease
MVQFLKVFARRMSLRQRSGGWPYLHAVSRFLEHCAVWTTEWVGSSWAFMIAAALTVLWLVSGPVFHYSDTWQLVMNTISSIVTFLMVFLLQRSQNKDSLAMQVKLNELVAAQRGASNRLINVEELSEDEVRELHRRYEQLKERSRRSSTATAARSIEQTAADCEFSTEAGAVQIHSSR